MRTVEDESGRRYVLLKRSREASLVRDVETGELSHQPTAELSVVDDASPLAAAAEGLPDAARRLVSTVRDDRTLGLLVALEAADGLAARTLLDAEDYCESDLHGLVSELRAAGLVAEATVDGEPGYRLTESAAAVVRALQSASASG
ncbi:MAG: hypothetical protein U5J98_12400 [Halobacteriales archaeon]|nr:hypothetical protein [Halobacteriales archaeon]